ncbi:DUF4156 domain-containing protein [Gilvimarinus sp. F26214L]|uniref:DUF4156 domain-containing protein n=1 Tax=Gilvimarinus sp. DZF01 TaxID=3461371 RepID=UPI004045382D
MRSWKLLTASVVLLTLNACSWVKLTPGAEQVYLRTQDQVAGCQRIGQTTSQVMDKVGFLDRSERKKAEELVTLARNEAASMGGDSIVPLSEPTAGRQQFAVYRCR